MLHPVLDGQINLETRRLIDRAQFRSVHTFYVTLSTVQWAAGLIYVLCTLHAWRKADYSQTTTFSREAVDQSAPAISQRVP
jgi:hypothetical protein